MSKGTRYSPELRERAVRMVFDHAHDHPSQWATIRSVAEKLGRTVEALRRWVRQAERDRGARPGLMMRTAAEWNLIDRVPCSIRLLNTPKTTAAFAHVDLKKRQICVVQSEWKGTWRCVGWARRRGEIEEAAGVERELAGFFKYSMVFGFWANLQCCNGLPTPAVSAAVPSDPLISTLFLER